LDSFFGFSFSLRCHRIAYIANQRLGEVANAIAPNRKLKAVSFLLISKRLSIDIFKCIR